MRKANRRGLPVITLGPAARAAFGPARVKLVSGQVVALGPSEMNRLRNNGVIVPSQVCFCGVKS